MTALIIAAMLGSALMSIGIVMAWTADGWIARIGRLIGRTKAMPECPVSMSGKHVPMENRPQNCKACGGIIGGAPVAVLESATDRRVREAAEGVVTRRAQALRDLEGVRDGETYIHEFDFERLNAQMRRVWDVVHDGQWRTLEEIAVACGDPEASISARLRDFRKPRFGGHNVERRHRAEAERGLYEYRLLAP